MDFSFSEEEEAFRQEVKTFLDENLTERLRAGSRGSPGVFVAVSYTHLTLPTIYSV